MDAIEKSTFTQRLKLLLDERGETIYSIAQIVHLSPSTISRYSNGLLVPKIITIEIMANHFNVNPVWLMGYDVNKENFSTLTPCSDRDNEKKEIVKIIDLYSKMSKNNQKKVYENILKLSKKTDAD